MSENESGKSYRSQRDVVVRTFYILADGACWIMAFVLALVMRLDADVQVLSEPATWAAAVLAATLHVVIGLLTGPYMVRHMRGSFDEVVAIVQTAVAAAFLLITIAWVTPDVFVPRSTALAAPALAIVLMLAVRFTVRSYRARQNAQNGGERLIVLGAGLAGRRLVHSMLHDDQGKFTPVAFLDDDPSKRRLKVEGIRVWGTREDLAEVVDRTRATHLAVAIPRADAELLRSVQEQAREIGLDVKVLPPLDEWLNRSEPTTTDLRDLNLEDLLGRRSVELDQDAIADHLSGKVVLVTGAGGSIGSELCRQIRRFNPARLVMLDRDESALHAAQLGMTGRALLHGEDLLLADIRDEQRLMDVFAEIRPDVVFHAAALKHLSLLERYPTEAWQTNVLGTLNVVKAAAAAGVGTFVNISTDKAASPISVLGYSKRVAERLTAHFASNEPGRYVSVRFGNVLGSRGSVIPAFTEQVRRGGPVTVTHPDVERYFMLIPEACQLVLQAGAIGRDGQTLVLDMGTPVKIVDVARELIALSGKHVDIQFTGLRPGEKLTEVLFMDDEDYQQTSHPMMTSADVPALDPTDLCQPGWSTGEVMALHAGKVRGEVMRP